VLQRVSCKQEHCQPDHSQGHPHADAQCHLPAHGSAWRECLACFYLAASWTAWAHTLSSLSHHQMPGAEVDKAASSAVPSLAVAGPASTSDAASVAASTVGTADSGTADGEASDTLAAAAVSETNGDGAHAADGPADGQEASVDSVVRELLDEMIAQATAGEVCPCGCDSTLHTQTPVCMLVCIQICVHIHTHTHTHTCAEGAGVDQSAASSLGLAGERGSGN
jgi:hypothetical protein